MADRDVLIKPRKVSLTTSTMANLLTKVKSITNVGSTAAGVAQDEIFAVPIDGSAGLFIGDAGGKVQGTTETDNVSTALTPVTTQTGLLPRDLLNAPDDTNADDFLIHMYDANTTPTVTGNRHRAFSLLKLKDYIGGTAFTAIGKVKVDSNDGAGWLEQKFVPADPLSFISISVVKDKMTASLDNFLKISATPNLSSQFTVTAGKQLTITTISGGSI